MHFLATLGIELPVIQAPMAGVQGSALALAVGRAGGLGSLPAAMLTVEDLRALLRGIRHRPEDHSGRPRTSAVQRSQRSAGRRSALAGGVALMQPSRHVPLIAHAVN